SFIRLRHAGHPDQARLVHHSAGRNSLIDSIDAALEKWEEVRRPPTDDSVFRVDVEADMRAEVSDRLQRLQRQINCVLAGLRKIDKSALLTRQQVKLFEEL
ncbi:hypothetical protein, partial [Mycobacterium parmense]|uniref:hypothetical protein n=1 Tax=Mycobacterium parmense TaxID=185642 RepID=UPI001B808097